MSMMHGVRRLMVKALAALILLAAVLALAAYGLARRSLPVVTGPVALYGLGYVHAQDRLWQMEFQRRIGHGRLS